MPKKLSPKVAKEWIAAGEKQASAIRLYLQGWSMRRIAGELGYAGPSGVHKAIRSAIAKVPAPAVNELRTEIEERSRLMLEELWPIVQNARRSVDDRLAAMDRIIRIDKERRAMHGADAPTKTEHTGKDGGPIVTYDLSKLTDEQLDRLIEGDVSALGGGAPRNTEGTGEGGEGTPEA